MNKIKIKKLAKKVHSGYYTMNRKNQKTQRLINLAEVAEEIGFLVSVETVVSPGAISVSRFRYYDDSFKSFLDEIRSIPKSTTEYEMTKIEEILVKYYERNNLLNIAKREAKEIYKLLKQRLERVFP